MPWLLYTRRPGIEKRILPEIWRGVCSPCLCIRRELEQTLLALSIAVVRQLLDSSRLFSPRCAFSLTVYFFSFVYSQLRVEWKMQKAAL